MDDVVHSETNGQRPSNAAPDTETRLLTTSIGFPKSRARTEMAQARQAQVLDLRDRKKTIASGTGRFNRVQGSGTWAGSGPSGLCSGIWNAVRS